MRDFATVVRDLLAGRIVTYKGSLFSVEKAKLDFDLSRRKIPIYLAAVRPKMLQLAGELGDGVLLSSMVSREYVLNAIDYVRMGAERIGKNLRDVDVACFISAFVSEDSEVAQAKAKAFVLRSLSSPGIFSDFHMWEIMFGREFRSALDFVRKSLRDSDLKSASKYVTDEMVSLVTIAGRPDECRRRLNEFVRAGVTVPVINPIPGSDPLVAIATFSQI
jgi:5,10-methylenetetrahydromethanopterin reductase